MTTEFIYSASIVVPAALRTDFIAFCADLDYSMGIPNRLSATGAEPATHFGTRCNNTALILVFMSGQLGKDLPNFTEAEAKALIAQIEFNIREVTEITSGRAHFDEHLALLGLQEITADLP